MRRSGRVRYLGLLWLCAIGLGSTVSYPGSSPARAELTPQDLLPCRAHDDVVERLRCYDQTASARASNGASADAAQSAYATTSITDLRLDADALAGKRITVTGALQQVGELVLLKQALFDANAIFIDVKRVPREERRRILELCARGCTATVSGKVERVMMQPGLLAEHVLVP